jgi:hypothetical protein
MRRLFFKISLLVVAIVAFVGIGLSFNGFGLTTIAHAEEPEYTATGSCGPRRIGIITRRQAL